VNRVPFVVICVVSMALRAARIALAGFCHKAALDTAHVFSISPPGADTFYWTELTINGLIAFVTFQSPRSRICIRMGHVVMLWVWVIDMLTLGFAAKELTKDYLHATYMGDILDPRLQALGGMDIAAAGLSFILFVWHCTFKDAHYGESQMPQPKLAVTWTLASLNGACRVVRIALVADYTNRLYAVVSNMDPNALNLLSVNVITVRFLPFWTFTALYGLLSLLTTFMYTMRWSRPTFYLNGVFLAVAFINDFTCLGWAAKMFDQGADPGIVGGPFKFEPEAVALGALSIISAIISLVQAFVHIWSSPPHSEASWFGACGIDDMKLTGPARNIHLGLSLPNLALRLVRVALASDLWNKYPDGTISSTESSRQAVAWTMWGAMGFAAAVSGHYYGFFFTKTTYVLHYLMLLFALSWDFGAGGFSVSQWVAGGLGTGADEWQAHAALSFIQFWFMLTTLIVHLAKAPMPNDDDENTTGTAASAGTGGSAAIPLDSQN